MTLETEFHTELEHQVARKFVLTATHLLYNYSLPNGKIADIITISTTSEITIIEIKTMLNHSLLSGAIKKYRAFCNRLYIAAPASEIAKLETATVDIAWKHDLKGAGIISIDNGNIVFTKRAGYHTLHPSVNQYLQLHISIRADPGRKQEQLLL